MKARTRLRVLIAIAALGVFLGPLDSYVGAQPLPRVHRIGWLSQASVPNKTDRDFGDFQRSLQDFGYAEGKNLTIEYRYADGQLKRLDELARELARLPVEIIVASGESAALAAKRATMTIPIIATEMNWDPVKAGLAMSLPRPGGNLTGIASEELWEKRLAVLKELAPKVSKIAVLWNPANAGNSACRSEIIAAAPRFKMDVQWIEIADSAALARALTTLSTDSVDALATCWDIISMAKAETIARFASNIGIPTLAPLTEYVQAGVLLSFGPSLSTQRRSAARYISKILQGTPPSDLAIENSQPKLVINGKTLQGLGLTAPMSLQVRVDEVY
jgi:putative ABC transport system substrate-binding protein